MQTRIMLRSLALGSFLFMEVCQASCPVDESNELDNTQPLTRAASPLKEERRDVKYLDFKRLTKDKPTEHSPRHHLRSKGISTCSPREEEWRKEEDILENTRRPGSSEKRNLTS